MPEQGEGSPKIDKIDPRWGSGEMPEPDINPYEAQRLKINEAKKREPIISDPRQLKLIEPADPPSNPASIKAWNKEIVRPDKFGRYRVRPDKFGIYR